LKHVVRHIEPMGPLTEGDLVLIREMIPAITQITLVKRSDPEFEGHLPMECLIFRKPDDTWVIGACIPLHISISNAHDQTASILFFKTIDAV
jgi:hypothetical protein